MTSTLSSTLGWLYFAAWSVSFYPQLLVNHRHRHTRLEGLSVDFLVLNLVGFICYSVYTCTLFWSIEAQDQFHKRFGSQAPLPSDADVAFAIHALTITTVTLVQSASILAGNSVARSIEADSGSRVISTSAFQLRNICSGANQIYKRVSPVVRIFTASVSILLIISAFYLPLLDVLYTTSVVKVVISLAKYIPQLLLNHARRSTAGWSIINILLDLAGGILSFAQLLLDSLDAGDVGLVYANPAKLMLGLTSLGFDTLFIIQHYILYPEPPAVPLRMDVESGVHPTEGTPLIPGRQ
ncbi:PQ loop repeat-domain-containing protein [Chytriomyces cf. hyalinus JEL632]|nr:PQ loop repeat-domain-containing protein [Chytriomyces cf. hyalinus JEL632]